MAAAVGPAAMAGGAGKPCWVPYAYSPCTTAVCFERDLAEAALQTQVKDRTGAQPGPLHGVAAGVPPHSRLFVLFIDGLHHDPETTVPWRVLWRL